MPDEVHAAKAIAKLLTNKCYYKVTKLCAVEPLLLPSIAEHPQFPYPAVVC